MKTSNEDIEQLIADARCDMVLDVEHRNALRDRLLAEYDKSRSTSSSPTTWLPLFQSFWRWVMARPISRLGIPAVLIAFATWGLFTLLPTSTGFALESFIKPLLTAKSGRCEIIVQSKDKKLPPFTFTAMFRGTAHRQESAEMGTVMIMDSAEGITVTLNPKEKQARIVQQINRVPNQMTEGGFLQQMRAQLLGLTKGKHLAQRVSLGEREVAGRKLIGYRIHGPGGQLDIWGDQKTGLPYSIVTNMAAFPNMEVTMLNFEFDIELDDALFNLTPPAGYTVTRDTMDMSPPSEKEFLAALRQFAEINGGVYPDTINAVQAITIATKYKQQLADKPADEQDREFSRIMKLLSGFTFPLQLPAEADATYAGKGIHRDDAEKPLFWYKPKGADKYRVIFADLSVVDAVAPPQLDGVQKWAPKTNGN